MISLLSIRPNRCTRPSSRRERGRSCLPKLGVRFYFTETSVYTDNDYGLVLVVELDTLFSSSSSSSSSDIGTGFPSSAVPIVPL